MSGAVQVLVASEFMFMHCIRHRIVGIVLEPQSNVAVELYKSPQPLQLKPSQRLV